MLAGKPKCFNCCELVNRDTTLEGGTVFTVTPSPELIPR